MQSQLSFQPLQPTLMCKNTMTNRRGGGRRSGGGRLGSGGRGGKDFGSAAAPKKKNQDFYEKLGKRKNCQKKSEKSIKIHKNIDFGGATEKRTSLSHSTRKTTPIDLFSSLYN